MQRQDSLEMLDFPFYHNIDSIYPKIHNNLKTDQLKLDSTIDQLKLKRISLIYMYIFAAIFS